MIKYIIVDDESIAHDIIREYADLLPNLKFEGQCYDAIEAMQYLNKNEIDLMFLDINMPKLKGIDFLKTLTHPPKVILTTAYKEYALEGYELNVVDYLLKPFSFERFLKAIHKVVNASAKAETRTTPSIASTKEDSKRLFIKDDKRHIQINLEDIFYIEASGNYTKLILNSDIITTREKLSVIQDLLPANKFIKVHKSFIVAQKHIHSIEGNRIFIGIHTIPIGKVYKLNINKLLKK